MRPVSGNQATVAGFTYTEVLVAMFLIAAVLVPAIDALHGGIQGGDVHAEQTRRQVLLVGKMEELLAQPYDELEQAADTAGGSDVIVGDYSDAAGSTDRRLVYLARYDADDADADADPFTGTDDGLLWLKVTIEDSAKQLESLVSR